MSGLRRYAGLRRTSARQRMTREKELQLVAWAEIRSRVFVRDDWKCRRCGCDGRAYKHREAMAPPRLDAAHIVPLGMGGSRYDQADPRNALDNLVTLCRQCHSEQTAGVWTWVDIGVTIAESLALRYAHLVSGRDRENTAS